MPASSASRTPRPSGCWRNPARISNSPPSGAWTCRASMNATLPRKCSDLVNASFERITYTEAIRLLAKSGKNFEFPTEWGVDMQSEHERYLTEEVFHKPVIVTDYPKGIKAF